MKNRREHTAPPAWPLRLFTWYCGSQAVEDLAGDMEELFYRDLAHMPVHRARWNYTRRTVVLLFSYAARKRRQYHRESYYAQRGANGFFLLNSYFKIGMRNLVKDRFFTLVNVLGLGIGMCVGLLALAAWVDVTEVDDFHTNGDHIYRVVTHYDDGNQERVYASTTAPLAGKIRQEFTGIRQVVPFQGEFGGEVIQPTGAFVPLRGYYTAPSFFDVFDFPLVAGNALSALEKPFSIALTQSSAHKLFGEQDPIGQQLEVKDMGSFEVTAVIKDYPRSHLFFEALVSYNTLAVLQRDGDPAFTLDAWEPISDYYTYLLLDPGKDPAEVEAQLAKVADTQFSSLTAKLDYKLQALNTIPKSDHYNEIGLAWGYLAMTVFFMLSLLILLPACFNYTNISIGRSLKRAKEIGLRKVAGGQNRHIFMQFLMETVIISILSLFLATGLFMWMRVEWLSMIVEGSRTFDLQITWPTAIAFLLFAVFTGLAAGIFPALYFSKLNPIETLRNASNTGKLSKVNTRKGLTVAQFALSLVFIMGVAILIKQYRYALNYDMGFQSENILDIPLGSVDPDLFRTEFSKLAAVRSISMSSSIPGSWEASSTWVKSSEEGDSIEIYQMFTDQHYLSNLELTLLAGAGFSQQPAQAAQSVIVNEQFLRDFAIASPGEALGQAFLVEDQQLVVQGVVKDFNHMPLREKIKGFFFRYQPGRFALANVRLASTDIQRTLTGLESTWQAVAPGQKFEPRFLDDELEKGFVAITYMVKVFGFLGLLAVSISCLGLLAMVVFTTESRAKEMGIRKVLGASVAQVVVILSGGFVKLVGIATLIAVPIGYFLFDKVFLRFHHYRAGIGLVEIVSSIVVLLLLSLLTIGSRTFVIARENPVESLRSE